MINNIQCPNCDNVSKYGEHCQCCSCALPENYSPDPDLYLPHFIYQGNNNLDPLAVRQLVRASHEIYRPAGGSTQEGEIPAILRVGKGEILPKYCREILRLQSPDSYPMQFDLVTVRVPLRRISELDHNFIIKYPSSIRPCLETVHQAINAVDEEPGNDEPGTRGSKTSQYVEKGRKPIIGIVDFGLDFAHEHFLKNKKTRIIALWDQSGTATNRNSGDIRYGTLYRRKEINAALRSNQPYQTLGYEPPVDSLFDAGAHGTYVTDIAAGSGFKGGAKGLAPDADIIFVDMARTSAHNVVGSRYGDSAHLLEAINFIFEEVRRIEQREGEGNIPLVVNLSVGSNDGPHDGFTSVEIGIDWLIETRGNCAVVVAAGNSADQILHATGDVKQDNFLDLLWYIPPYDTTSNEIEVWHSLKDKFAVQILDPDNAPLCKPVECGGYAEISMGSEGRMIIINRDSDPYNDLREKKDKDKKVAIYVLFERSEGYLKKGRWKLRLIAGSIGKDGRFDAWIERDERGQSVFVEPCDETYEISPDKTLNSIANGEHTIVAGSFEVGDDSTPDRASSFSSFDLRSCDGPRPHILAPGKNILAARSRTSVLRYRQSGTSMSSAVVTGVVARMLYSKPELSHAEIKETLKNAITERLEIGDKGNIGCLDAAKAMR